MKTKGNLKTEEQFHHEAIVHMLQHSDAATLKKDLSALMQHALNSEMVQEFPEQLPERFYSFKLLHNLLVQLIFYHQKELKPEHFLLE